MLKYYIPVIESTWQDEIQNHTMLFARSGQHFIWDFIELLQRHLVLIIVENCQICVTAHFFKKKHLTQINVLEHNYPCLLMLNNVYKLVIWKYYTNI